MARFADARKPLSQSKKKPQASMRVCPHLLVDKDHICNNCTNTKRRFEFGHLNYDESATNKLIHATTSLPLYLIQDLKDDATMRFQQDQGLTAFAIAKQQEEICCVWECTDRRVIAAKAIEEVKDGTNAYLPEVSLTRTPTNSEPLCAVGSNNNAGTHPVPVPDATAVTNSFIEGIKNRPTNIEMRQNQQDQRLGAVEEKQKELDNRLAAVEVKQRDQDNRLGTVEAKSKVTEEKQKGRDSRLSAIEVKHKEHDVLLSAIETKLKETEERQKVQNERMDTIESKLKEVLEHQREQRGTRKRSHSGLISLSSANRPAAMPDAPPSAPVPDTNQSATIPDAPPSAPVPDTNESATMPDATPSS